MEQIGKNCQARSLLEVVALQGVIDMYLSEVKIQDIRRMRIFSPYHAHYNLLRSLLDVIYPQLNVVGNRIMTDSVRMVLSCRGMKDEVIIFIDGRGPLENRTLGEDSLLDSLRDL